MRSLQNSTNSLVSHSSEFNLNLEGTLDVKTVISECASYKKRLEKAEEQKERVEKIMNDCIK